MPSIGEIIGKSRGPLTGYAARNQQALTNFIFMMKCLETDFRDCKASHLGILVLYAQMVHNYRTFLKLRSEQEKYQYATRIGILNLEEVKKNRLQACDDIRQRILSGEFSACSQFRGLLPHMPTYAEKLVKETLASMQSQTNEVAG